jgi:tetratricopeptide (TPR) repeat protein
MDPKNSSYYHEYLPWLRKLVKIYIVTGKLDKAIILCQKKLQWGENIYGKLCFVNVVEYSELAYCYHLNQEYEEAEENFEKALESERKQFGWTSVGCAIILGDLSETKIAQGCYGHAEKVLLQSLKMLSALAGEENDHYVNNLWRLIELYTLQGKYHLAEDFLKEVLVNIEGSTGINSKIYAKISEWLAALYYQQGCYSEAEVLMRKCLKIVEQIAGKDHPNYAVGKDHPNYAIAARNLEKIYVAQNQHK